MTKVTDCPKCQDRAYASNFWSTDEEHKGQLYYCFNCQEYFTDEGIFIGKAHIEAHPVVVFWGIMI